MILVAGPPAAGKSTWIRDHAKPGDITIDYDTLAQALSPGLSSDPAKHWHLEERTVSPFKPASRGRGTNVPRQHT